jgi:hypothetical protein
MSSSDIQSDVVDDVVAEDAADEMTAIVRTTIGIALTTDSTNSQK